MHGLVNVMLRSFHKLSAKKVGKIFILFKENEYTSEETTQTEYFASLVHGRYSQRKAFIQMVHTFILELMSLLFKKKTK